jgi:hypothetical protein
VGHLDLKPRGVVDRGGGPSGVVTSDGDEQVHPELRQRVEDILHVLFVFGGVEARGPDDGAAEVMDAGDVLDIEGHDMGGVASGEPMAPVTDADHLQPMVSRLDGRCPDDAVDPG